MCSGITCGRVFNGELYTQRFRSYFICNYLQTVQSVFFTSLLVTYPTHKTLMARNLAPEGLLLILHINIVSHGLGEGVQTSTV